MKLSEHFTLDEFTASSNAARRGIDNSVPEHLMPAAVDTAGMMERIRAALGGKPVTITSGYRCKAVNDLAGSGDVSDHLKAAAVDFKCPAFGTPYEVAAFLASRIDELGIGQIIHEFGQWVHVSTRKPAKAVNRIITISGKGIQVGVVRV